MRAAVARIRCKERVKAPPGARRTAELVQADARVTVPVLDVGSPHVAGVRALNVLVENLRLTAQALVSIDDVVVTTGGDCGVELAPIAAAVARYGADLTVLWLDAHPDVNTPETLPSGSFHGMVLGTLLGEGAAVLIPEKTLSPGQVILGGVRAFEPGEREYIDSAGIRGHDVDDLAGMLDGLTGPVYLHIDLDVLDPMEFSSVGYPEPNGVPAERLIDLVSLTTVRCRTSERLSG